MLECRGGGLFGLEFGVLLSMLVGRGVVGRRRTCYVWLFLGVLSEVEDIYCVVRLNTVRRCLEEESLYTKRLLTLGYIKIVNQREGG